MHFLKFIIFNLKLRFSELSTRVAIRVSLKKKLGLALFEHATVINSSNPDDYCLWDLEDLTYLGRLPYNSDNGFRLNAHRGCVRLECNGQHKLLLPWSIFFINGRHHVVIPYRQQSIKDPKKLRFLLPATTLSILLIVLSTWGVLSQNLSAGTPRKTDTLKNLSSANETELTHPINETYNPNSASRDSISTHSTARSRRRVQSRNTDLLKHESSSTEIHVPDGRKIDPLRCQPIIQKHKSMMMNRLAQQAESEGSWYVCR